MCKYFCIQHKCGPARKTTDMGCLSKNLEKSMVSKALSFDQAQGHVAVNTEKYKQSIMNKRCDLRAYILILLNILVRSNVVDELVTFRWLSDIT